ncbi:MAG: 3-dehydroquinate synthase family protein, partial [Cutibacterium granulosum]|nr:3-dehydroquinate synthase family protein [Cutibacterium granulosum]
MDRITVNTERPYDVVVGAGASRLLTDVAGGRRVALIHPASMTEQARQLNALLTDSVEIIVPDAERAKTPECLLTCWQRLAEAGFTRDDLVVSLGGGATTDLAGLVAATWLRGVDVVHLPTTVLAMADAAIGGKTGINLVSGKNLVGAFHQPLAVLCDTDLLGSLDGREVRSGLAEIVKCGFIADPSILECIRAAPQAVLDTGSEQFRTVLEAAVRVKAAVVASDP